jgi:hypothetical protein
MVSGYRMLDAGGGGYPRMEKWTIGKEANVALIIVYFPIRGNLLRGHLSHQRPDAGEDTHG